MPPSSCRRRSHRRRTRVRRPWRPAARRAPRPTLEQDAESGLWWTAALSEPRGGMKIDLAPRAERQRDLLGVAGGEQPLETPAPDRISLCAGFDGGRHGGSFAQEVSAAIGNEPCGGSAHRLICVAHGVLGRTAREAPAARHVLGYVLSARLTAGRTDARGPFRLEGSFAGGRVRRSTAAESGRPHSTGARR